jgi:hypothetical protein
MASELQQALLDERVGLLRKSPNGSCPFPAELIVHPVPLANSNDMGGVYAGGLELNVFRITKPIRNLKAVEETKTIQRS